MASRWRTCLVVIARNEAATITRLLGHFQTVLEGIAANPDCRLSVLPLLTAAEREQLTDRLAKFAQSEAVQKVIGKVAFETHEDGIDPLLLRAMGRVQG